MRVATSPINDANVEQATLRVLPAYTALAGQTLQLPIDGLKSNTTYYLALRSADRWGNKSAGYTYIQAATTGNHKPVFTYKATDVPTLAGDDVHQLFVELSDADGDELELTVSGEERGVEWHRTDKGIQFTLRALAPEGSHAIIIEARDPYRQTAKLRIPFRVVKNTAPTIVRPLEEQWLSLHGGNVQLDLAKVFADSEDALSYQVQVLNGGTGEVDTQIVGTVLSLSPRKAGSVTLQVVAIDKHGARATQIVEVKVADATLVFQAFPIPASTQLNLRLAPSALQGEYHIYNTVGELALHGKYDLKGAASSLLAVDVSGLRSGSYVLHLNSGPQLQKLNFIVR